MPMQSLSNTVLPMKARSASLPSAAAFSKRVSHGGTRFANVSKLRQPQDGARITAEMPYRITSITGSVQPSLFQEPEDARLTGATRSLFRRLMGLNVVSTPLPEPAPAVTSKPARKQTTSVGSMLSQARVA